MGDSGPRTESTLSFLRSNGVTNGGADVRVTWTGSGRGFARGRRDMDGTVLFEMLGDLECLSIGTADILNNSGCARGCGPHLILFNRFSSMGNEPWEGNFGDGAETVCWWHPAGLTRLYTISDEVESSEQSDDEKCDL